MLSQSNAMVETAKQLKLPITPMTATNASSGMVNLDDYFKNRDKLQPQNLPINKAEYKNLLIDKINKATAIVEEDTHNMFTAKKFSALPTHKERAVTTSNGFRSNPKARDVKTSLGGSRQATHQSGLGFLQKGRNNSQHLSS